MATEREIRETKEQKYSKNTNFSELSSGVGFIMINENGHWGNVEYRKTNVDGQMEPSVFGQRGRKFTHTAKTEDGTEIKVDPDQSVVRSSLLW